MQVIQVNYLNNHAKKKKQEKKKLLTSALLHMFYCSWENQKKTTTKTKTKTKTPTLHYQHWQNLPTSPRPPTLDLRKMRRTGWVQEGRSPPDRWGQDPTGSPGWKIRWARGRGWRLG
jgi:hypothetical protein